MTLTISKQRVYAALLVLGAGVLLGRTLIMIFQGALQVLVWWVWALLIMELAIDLTCMLASGNWFLSNNPAKNGVPLRLGAAAAIVHTFRILIFVLGRVGPWFNFDVQLEYWTLHHTTWTWGEVYSAAIMSVLGIIGVVVIWRLRIGRKKKLEKRGHNCLRNEK